MRGIVSASEILKLSVLISSALLPFLPACGQSTVQSKLQQVDLASVGKLLQELQGQVQELHTQVNDLKAQQQSAKDESVELRKELEAAQSQLIALAAPASPIRPIQSHPNGPASVTEATDERITKLEDSQQLADSKIAEQSQTKIESGSKYRVRLSGIVLFSMYGNRGTVENVDIPQIAEAPGPLSSSGSFGGSLRQSQVGIEAFGPTIAGARTSANIQFDFAGGFPETSNGVSFGLMRLRTGTVHFDWADTSLVAGQDSLFFVPLSPTSIATMAIPSLAYSGNLWSWTPQVRVQHKFAVSGSSSLLLQGGLLDSLSGDVPPAQYYRYPTWGESSGQPAYAARVAWSRAFEGQDLTLGVGGYYGRQAWGYNRGVDSWAGTIDLKVPLGNYFEFTGAFYRGRALGGLSGGVGQSVLWNGSLLNPETQLNGLNALGGWAQLKYKATPKLQFNVAFGQDNPYASDLREYAGNATYYPVPISKNQSAFVNFIYQIRSDVVFSVEYRRLKTFTLDSAADSANLFNLSLGYIF
jgi:hypothetical protein